MEERLPEHPHRGCEPAEPRLLQLRSDRRLGHEWDDWDGQPLPHDGVFRERSGLFFALTAFWMALALGGAGLLLWLVAPRLSALSPVLPTVLGLAIATCAVVATLWLSALACSTATGRHLLPARLAEGGILPRVLPMAARVGPWFGISRDRAGNAALRVFNALTAARARPGVRPDQLLVLLPRCLDKPTMQAAMDLSGRYGVPLFVAARGRYAREMIARVRPRAVVAVACERDLVSGVHDVAARLPVLGTTLSLPEGPCKNTGAEITTLEAQIRSFLGLGAAPSDQAARA